MKNTFEVKASLAFYRHELRIKDLKIRHLAAGKSQLTEEFKAVTEEFSDVQKDIEKKLSFLEAIGQQSGIEQFLDKISLNKIVMKKNEGVYNSKINQLNTEIELEIQSKESLTILVSDLESISKDSENHYGR